MTTLFLNLSVVRTYDLPNQRRFFQLIITYTFSFYLFVHVPCLKLVQVLAGLVDPTPG